MIFVSDYFAIVIGIVLIWFYFVNLRLPSRQAVIFAQSLVLSVVTSLFGILSDIVTKLPTHNHAFCILSLSLYHIIEYLAMAWVSLYLMNKILEHTNEKKCVRVASWMTAILAIIYAVLLIVNVNTGIVFKIEDGIHSRGPLIYFAYVADVLLFFMTILCYVRNRRIVSNSLTRALRHTLPLIAFSIIVQLVFEDVMLSGFIIVVINMVIYLNFQKKRLGEHVLTALDDRSKFFQDLNLLLKRHRPRQLFLINLKNFSVVNQKFGHQFGDEVLFVFARSLTSQFVKASAYHMNGTVFALSLPYVDKVKLQENTEKLQDLLDTGIRVGDRRIDLDYVCVEYILSGIEKEPHELFDSMEYTGSVAYNRGEHFVCYDEAYAKEMQNRARLITLLSTIDSAHGYEVFYQPIRDIRKNAYASMEALIRLRDANGSLVSPAQLIPIAEETGKIHNITWFVLEEVCRTLNQNPIFADIHVSINISMTQLLDKGFLHRINEIVDSYRIAHSRIVFEITERVMLENLEDTEAVMKAISSMGYAFYLDDFGAGCSNFSTLLQLPFKCIKLDRAFLANTMQGNVRTGIVRHLCEMFHDAGLSVTAEGAECAEDVATLVECGVDSIQGYYFARPMPLNTLIEFLAKDE
ncbi:MAG: EAL domain-containing protein [Clostridia bacterium]|nr:EAL domain-containing protein [Clostridia bacterium]